MRAAIPEYWVVDVNARIVLIHSRPTGDAYAERETVAFDKRAMAATIAGLTVDSDQLG